MVNVGDESGGELLGVQILTHFESLLFSHCSRQVHSLSGRVLQRSFCTWLMFETADVSDRIGSIYRKYHV